jgi:endonuclease/exonuclease/phosphatase family metal-dependent hydrolase
LTGPVCKSHIFFRQSSTIDALYPDSYRITNWARKAAYLSGTCFYGLASVPFTLQGMAFRYAVCQLQKETFTYREGNAPEKTLEAGQEFSHLAANVACNSSGHSISDAGVMPWPYRIEAICRKVLKQQADVVTLYEVFDPAAAYYFYEKMKGEYAHFYFNMGPRVLGVNSGIFVASKYAIKNAQFTAFPKEMLVDRTKNAEKGIFSFDLASMGKIFARIITSHLQHSEEPAYATSKELKARQDEMVLMMQKVDKTPKDRAVIVVGDLNMDDEEYNAQPWSKLFTKINDFKGKFTWGGDGWCAKMFGVGKKRSGPLNLDHCMILNGTAQSIKTELITTADDAFPAIEFDGDKFQREPLSDHGWLLSRIFLKA